MRARTNVILLAIAVALTAYVSLFERGSPSFTQRGRVFKDLEPADIVEVEISRPSLRKDAGLGIDVRPIKVRREGSPPEWWIVEPIHYEAYHPRMQSIAYDIADLVRVADVPAEAAASLQGEVQVLVKVKTRRGDEHTIEVGPDHPDPKLELSYMKVDGSPFVSRRDFRKGMLVTLEELRTRALLGIAPADATFVAVSGESPFEKTLEREGTSDRWRVKKPIDAMADAELVETFLKDLNAWAVTSFVNDAVQAQDLPGFGLEKPRAAVTLRHRDGREIILEVGADAPPSGNDAQVYVRHRGKPFVFAASAAPLKQLFDRADGFRTRYVFDLGLEDVDELEGEMGAGRVRLRREKEKDGKGFAWQVLDPAGKVVFPGDKKDMEAVLVSLRKLLILKYLPDEPASPTGVLSLRTVSGRKLELRIGALSNAPEDRGQNVYTVSVPGEPGAYLVSTVVPSKLQAGAIAFRKKDVSDVETASLLELEIIDGASSWMLARTGPHEPWMLGADPAPLKGKELSSKIVDEVLLPLHREGFRVKRFLPDVTDLPARGLELTNPRRAIVFHRFDGNETPAFRKLVLGSVVEDSNPVEFHARVDIVDLPPFVLDEEIPKNFDALVKHLREVTGK